MHHDEYDSCTAKSLFPYNCCGWLKRKMLTVVAMSRWETVWSPDLHDKRPAQNTSGSYRLNAYQWSGNKKDRTSDFLKTFYSKAQLSDFLSDDCLTCQNISVWNHWGNIQLKKSIISEFHNLFPSCSSESLDYKINTWSRDLETEILAEDWKSVGTVTPSQTWESITPVMYVCAWQCGQIKHFGSRLEWHVKEILQLVKSIKMPKTTRIDRQKIVFLQQQSDSESDICHKIGISQHIVDAVKEKKRRRGWSIPNYRRTHMKIVGNRC